MQKRIAGVSVNGAMESHRLMQRCSTSIGSVVELRDVCIVSVPEAKMLCVGFDPAVTPRR